MVTTQAVEKVLDTVKVIDVDTHITEPADLWTRRLSPDKWGEQVLQVRPRPNDAGLGWFIGDRYVGVAPAGATAAWTRNPDFHPASPKSYDDVDAGAYDARARLQWMDRAGIHAQVLYPNVAGFAAGFLMWINDTELRLEHIRAYNDFMVDWSSLDKDRLIPIGLLPFWDMDEAVKEAQRVAKLGHRGVTIANMPETLDQPMLSDPAWNPLWTVAQDLGLSINFHIGSGERDREKEFKAFAEGDAMGTPLKAYPGNGIKTNLARQSVLFFLDNARAITEIIVSGVCHRFPKLNFVSVESGAGWLPFICEALDWQWVNMGASTEHPEYDLKPSEYFKRQIYACFWFEQAGLKSMLDFAPNNILFETDFPHPTSLTPGPLSTAKLPKDHIKDVFAGIPAELTRKAIHDNAARLYRLA